MSEPKYYKIEPHVFVVEGPPHSGVTEGLIDFTKAFLTSDFEHEVLFLTDSMNPEKVLHRFQASVPENSGKCGPLDISTLSRINVRRFLTPDDVTPHAIMDILSATKPIGMVVVDSLRLTSHDVPRAKWLLYELSVKANVEIAVGIPTNREPR